MATQEKDIRDQIIDWLRDAYAMEKGLELALEKQAKNEDLNSQIRQRAASHLEETRRHAELVQDALKSLNSDTSTIKTGLGMMGQTVKGVGTAFSQDERIKDLLDAYSMEHFEIACYSALESAAKKAGLHQVVQMCQRIIPDEKRMAERILGNLPTEVVDYLFEEKHAMA